jgi:hypothetical protein
MEKYYKPNPDEFCIGSTYYMPILNAIYDSKGRIDYFEETGEYNQIKIEEYLHYEQCFSKYRDEEGVEVTGVPENAVMKFLDKEDIEVTGFLFEDNNHYMQFTENVRGNELDLELIHNIEDNSVHILNWVSYNSFTLFDGYIKNKHELQTLLKQLGIV